METPIWRDQRRTLVAATRTAAGNLCGPNDPRFQVQGVVRDNRTGAVRNVRGIATVCPASATPAHEHHSQLEAMDWDGHVRPVFSDGAGHDMLPEEPMMVVPPPAPSVIYAEPQVHGQNLAFYPPQFSDHLFYLRPGFRNDVANYGGPPAMLHSGVNIQLGLVTLLQGEHLGMERHSEGVQVFYVLQGTGEFVGFETGLALSPGDVLVIPRNMPHNIRNRDYSPLHLLTFYTPKVHPGVRGIYERKHIIQTADELMGTRASALLPYTGPSRVELVHAALMAMMSGELRRRALLADVESFALYAMTLEPGTRQAMLREGYHYVVYGGGSVQIHGYHNDTVTHMEAGGMYYIPPDTAHWFKADWGQGSTRVLVFSTSAPFHPHMERILRETYGHEQDIEAMLDADALVAEQHRHPHERRVPESEPDTVMRYLESMGERLRQQEGEDRSNA